MPEKFTTIDKYLKKDCKFFRLKSNTQIVYQKDLYISSNHNYLKNNKINTAYLWKKPIDPSTDCHRWPETGHSSWFIHQYALRAGNQD
jgi:hypothetical protein